MSLRAACIGECMVELRRRPDGAYAQAFAGDAYNTAFHLKRELGPAAEVAFVSALGDDALSSAMRRAFREDGVDDRLVFETPGGAPGLYLVEVDASGERSFTYWRSASAARGWLRELTSAGGEDALAAFDLVYLSGVSLAILPAEARGGAVALMATLRRRGVRVAFDPNVRPRLWESADAARQVVAAAAATADILLPSVQDGELLWAVTDAPAQMARWRAHGGAEVAMTLGAAGAWAISAEGEAKAPPLKPARVVDTTGAGDSFNGAYLAARLRGRDPDAATQRAVALAAEVVGYPGALPSRPTGATGSAPS